MSTFTIRVTSSATNIAGTAYGQQPDLGAPSFLDMVVTGSTDPLLSNGVYDAYCLNPLIEILVSPTTYIAENSAGNTSASFAPIGFSSLMQTQVDQLNWLLAQNFTSDPKFGGQFNFGEVQTAIWKIIGFTDAQINGAGLQLFLNDNNRNVVNANDINFLISSAQSAIASGNGVVPTDAFFTTIIDPAGNVQPLIVQLQSAKLGNYVWSDSNANGIQDIGETGVNNVVVELWSNGVKVASTITGDDFSTATVEQGFYQFNGLKAGNYQVKFITPAGQFLTSQDANGNSQDAADSDANALTGLSQLIALAAGESNQTIDAGLYQKATLGDRVWEDKNANGVQEAGENGLQGVTVQLKNADGTVNQATTTDANGNYLFTVDPGTYTVAIVKPAGYEISPANQGGDDAQDSDVDSTGVATPTQLTAGETDLTWDAGLYQLAELGNRVWLDTNKNGVQDSGEAGVQSVKVTLLDAQGNAVGSSQLTDANGNYLFTGLKPGTYSVQFDKTTLPAGYVFTAQDAAAGTDTTDSDAGIVDGKTVQTVLDSGESDLSWDAGIVATPAQIGDKVWLDKNANGVQDAGEAGISGVTVELKNAGGTVIQSTTTDANGLYSFSVDPGTYSVAIQTPSGYVITGQDLGGDDAKDSDINASGQTGTYTLAAGQTDLTADAGLYQLAQLGDRVWLDTNKNGVQDSGETGVQGVKVTLLDSNGVAVGSPLVTDANGNYLFTGLKPGTYSVQFDKTTLPAGYVFTAQDAAAGTDTTDSDAGIVDGKTVQTVLDSGESDLSWDAGIVATPAQIGDKVWLDKNANGVQDAGEAGISGVTVELKNAGGTVIQSTTTDANGLYSFSVDPGTYSVAIQTPSGYVITGQDLGGDDAKDSDINASGQTGTYTLAAGQTDLTADAGLYQLAQLGDRVWLDTNKNGVQDSGETGVQGVKVTLLDSNGVAVGSPLVTDANGNYLFTGLKPGTYSVQFDKTTLPAGYVFTAQDAAAGTDATDSDAGIVDGKTVQTVLDSGESDLSWDAGIVAPAKASIGDRVWKDCDGDGIQDATESGVAGVTVKLLGADGTTVLKTTTTDANGNYLFNNLDVGNYAIQVVTPNGYKFTAKNQGANDSIDSDVDQVTGKTAVTSLVAGENDLSWDAGLIVPANCVDFNFNGSSGTDGTDGNIRTYTVNGISVNASAFSRTDAGTWSTAFLGSYSGGLGVTDSSEGSGSGSSHTVDNYGRDNYVLFEFNQSVVVDKAYLGYVVGDSDMQIWIGTTNTPFSNHLTLTDAILNGMGFTEINATTLTTARWAELNAGGFVGNTLIIAADTTDTTPDDYFKIQSLSVCGPTCANPKASIGDFVWEDANYNGIQDSGEKGIANVTVKLLSSTGTVLQTTTTDANGKYGFDVDAGSYKVQVVKPTGYYVTKQDQGSNDGIDSDINTSGITGLYMVTAGQQNLTIDAGLYRKASIGDRVWEDSDHDGVQDSGEFSIAGVKVYLQNSSGVTIASTTTNSYGNYLFANLDPGTYRLMFDKTDVLHNSYWGGTYNMNDWKWGVKNVGSNDSIDSDVTGDGISKVNKTYTDYTFLQSGEDDRSWDAAITPIVIDLNGDGIKTVSRADSIGTFDLLGNGKEIQSGWLSNDDGFLAIDRDANGKIDNVSELFGGSNKGDGFAKLASFDSNGDSWIDAGDANFASLLIWRDGNGNHQTDDGELLTLGDAGITQLNVNFTELPFVDAQGNLHFERSSAVLDNGNAVDMTDVYFNVSLADAAEAGVQLSSMVDLLGESVQPEVVITGAVNVAPEIYAGV